MTQTKRLIINVIATNGRSLYTMVCGLLTGRWMLLSLGAQDYGLLGLIGGLIAFMTIFNGLFSSAVSRYFAFALGEAKVDGSAKGLEECRRWFTLAIVIHIALPCAVFACGYPIGEWAVRHWLTIPPTRIEACVWVFRFACLSCIVGIVGVPFRAMYVAKQEIAELTIYTFVTATANVGVLYYMVTHQRDWLVLMAAWMAMQVIAPAVIIAIRAVFIYSECRFVPRYMFDFKRMRQLFSFAGWQFFGNLGAMLRDQGNAILVNKFLGPVFNATNTIANTVSSHTLMFANEMSGAFMPAITTACGAKDYKLMDKLVQRCSKYSGLAVALFAIPLILEMEGLVTLWLKTPPPYVAEIAICGCLACVVNKATCGQWMAVSAFARVAKINIAEFAAYMLMVALTGIALALGGSIVWIGYSMLVSLCFLAFLRVIIARREGNVSALVWVKSVVVPIVLVSGVTYLIAAVVRHFISPSVVRIFIVCGIAGVLFIILSWFFALESEERDFILMRFKKYKV